MRRAVAIVAALAIVFACCVLVAAWGREKATRPLGSGQKVRFPAVAGAFYPGDRIALDRFVQDSLKVATREQWPLPIRAILAPHAGYIYCGRTMAAAYKQIEGDAFIYDRVVLIGPSHRVRTKAAAVSSAEAWETPLGSIPVDTAAARKLAQANDRIELNDLAHAMEHSLEVQLPYLVTAARGKPFKIVPILTNSADRTDQEIVARALTELASDSSSLIVVSSDLSHFPTSEVAETVDHEILRAVVSLSADTLSSENSKLLKAGHAGLDCTMCGLDAALCLQRAATGLGIREARIVSYTHSGMIGGDSKRVVGYGAVVFLGTGKDSPQQDGALPLTFSEEARRELVSLARSAVKAALEGREMDITPSSTPDLQVKAGCFVTLKSKGKLRGCIGCFQSDEPLWKTVREMAISSATKDYRFASAPIEPHEVPELDVEISVLSPMRRVAKPLREIKLGRDGILIQGQGRSGTFLPQVATETGWSLEEFLGHCSRDKAGLGWDGWKSPTADVYAYTAIVIKEGE